MKLICLKERNFSDLYANIYSVMENNWIASHPLKNNSFLTTGEVCLHPITEEIQRTAVRCVF
jgi:hypothetical protein